MAVRPNRSQGIGPLTDSLCTYAEQINIDHRNIGRGAVCISNAALAKLSQQVLLAVKKIATFIEDPTDSAGLLLLAQLIAVFTITCDNRSCDRFERGSIERN